MPIKPSQLRTEKELVKSDRKVFYRFDTAKYSREPEIRQRVFHLVKETPKGYWIKENIFWEKEKRWIPKVSRKRYAYPIKIEALRSYIARKKRQIRILKNDLYFAEEGVKIATKLLEDDS